MNIYAFSGVIGEKQYKISGCCVVGILSNRHFLKLLIRCLLIVPFVYNIQAYPNEEYFQTPVDFIIAGELINEKQAVDRFIEQSIDSSNTILKNSGLPIIRTLGTKKFASSLDDINYDRADMVMAQLVVFNRPLYEELLSKETVTVLVFSTTPNYVGVCGSVSPQQFPTLVVVDASCDSWVLEHEIGHLYGAHHEKSSFDKALGESYRYESFAAKCGDYGTIMSAVTDVEKVLPIYSSPTLTYNGKACGDKSTNNVGLLWSKRAYFSSSR